MSAELAEIADVVALATGFGDTALAGAGDTSIQLFLDIAADLISEDTWGDKLSRAHQLLAAHVGAEAIGSSGAGATLTSRRMGQIGETYATSMPSDSELAGSKYGRLFILLRRTLVRSSSYGEDDRGWENTEQTVP